MRYYLSKMCGIRIREIFVDTINRTTKRPFAQAVHTTLKTGEIEN